MDIRTFCAQSTELFLYEQQSVICFVSAAGSYPLLFFSHLHTQLRASDMHAQAIDVTTHDVASIKGQCETSFLGNRTIYWLRGMHTLDKRKLPEWISYLNRYQGPNTLLLYLDQDMVRHVPRQWCVINLPPYVDEKLFTDLTSFWGTGDCNRMASYTQQLFAQRKQVPLDTACLLFHYGMLVGRQAGPFLTEWLDKLSVPDASLFTLSQYFFAKRPQEFFQLWRTLAAVYPAPFWTTFWSEQLWRAYYYVALASQNNRTDAKKISFKLPFSFIQRDWQRYDARELRNAHSMIYTIDHKVKNSTQLPVFDLFYSKFFSGSFS